MCHKVLVLVRVSVSVSVSIMWLCGYMTAALVIMWSNMEIDLVLVKRSIFFEYVK